MANIFMEQLIRPDGAKSADGMLEFDVRIPWYRSLPLSVVEVSELVIDGQPVPPGNVTIELNGQAFLCDALADRVEDWWYVLDYARLRANAPQLKAGARHDVELSLTLFPPYIPNLVWVTKARKSVNAG